jgi:glycosyltransferase involved in cell wall biosynthesis
MLSRVPKYVGDPGDPGDRGRDAPSRPRRISVTVGKACHALGLSRRMSGHEVCLGRHSGSLVEATRRRFLSWILPVKRVAHKEEETRSTVVHIIGSLNRGGAETVTIDLVRQTEPYICSTIVSLTDPPGPLTIRARSVGAAVVSCSLHPRITFGFRLHRLLRDIAPHAVVSHVSLFSAFPLAVARLVGVPVRIARLHSAGDGAPDTPARLVYRWIARFALQATATEVLAVSGAAAAFAGGKRFSLERDGNGRYSVLRNGVDTARFAPQEEFGPAESEKVLLHIGRNHPDKNRGLLPGIIESLVSLDAGWKLWIVGAGRPDDVEESPTFESALPNIKLLGEREDVQVVLRQARVLILPSRREGLPGVILEALACGVPVVCTDLPTLRELASELPGITLVPLNAPDREWAAAVVRAAEEFPWPAMKLRAELIEHGWDVSASSKEWLRRLTHAGNDGLAKS